MKDKKLFITIVFIFTIISFIIGVSYAYFTVQVVGNDTASTQNIKTGTLKINYTGTDTLDMNNTQPPDTKSMTFTVTNSGTLPVNNYQVYFSKVINQILYDEMVYTLICQSSDANPCLGKEETPLPKEASSALTQPSIAPGTTHTYTLSVTFKDTGSNQDYNQEKQLSFKITINELEEFPPASLLARGVEYEEPVRTHFWEYSERIIEISFENGISIPETVYKSWDVSENQDESIMAYIILVDEKNDFDENLIKLYIQSNGEVYANSNSSYIFANFSELRIINNLNSLNTSNVTDMSWMFLGCSSLTNLDVSNFDTSKVTDMQYMFAGCMSLKVLDLSNFDTSNLIFMDHMFGFFRNIKTGFTHLNLSSFNTSKVVSMNGLFVGCYYLEEVNISSFDTENVTDMSNMFSHCYSLQSLNLQNLKTDKVTNMSNMFSSCTSIVELDLSSFNTINVENMSGMFANCEELTSLDLSSFYTPKLTAVGHNYFIFLGMFSDCTKLINLNMQNFDFSNVTDDGNMFSSITSGINIIVKDNDAQTFINARLSDEGRTGNVTIYVP